MKKIVSITVAVLCLMGCSKRGNEAVQRVINGGTGKTQVDTYMQLKRQIKAINQENAKRLDE